MNTLAEALVPVVIVLAAVFALMRRVDIFSALTDGAKSGMKIVVGMLPPLIALLSAVYMLRASGLTEALARLLSPVFGLLGLPEETAPLMLLRPFSGSGALSVASELIDTHGADSFVGRTAAVMLGSTETTFYVIAVYFGAAGVKKSRRAVPAALAADFCGFFTAALFVRLLMN